MARIAFYAPIKPPDHPIPSGDREIARALVAALRKAGYEVEIASGYIAYIKRSSRETFERKRQEAANEAADLLTRWQAPGAARPDLWLTYHPYCKAPDFLGPDISDALAIPYVTAEACRTGQGTEADWADGRRVTQDAIRCAAVNLCLKKSDDTYLRSVLGNDRTIAQLAPFITVPPQIDKADTGRDGPVRLITVAMMRPGAKTASYEMLAAALARVKEKDWTLDIIGDGPERPRVESMFLRFGDRVRFAGALVREDIPERLAAGDLYVWPGMREAIGLAYLEAQAQGLPVVAQATLGVPWVVRDGETGLLTPENDVPAFAQALGTLISDPPLRREMGAAARAHVETRHSADTAAQTLRSILDSVLSKTVR